MNKKRRCLYLLVLAALATLYTASPALGGGEVVSTSITVNNQAFGDMVANSTLFYYWNGSSTKYVTENTSAEDIQPFAYVDLDGEGNISVEIGENNTLPQTTILLINDDRTPNLNTSLDANHIQVQGNGTDSSHITYSGANNTNKIYCKDDCRVYVFLNTGDAVTGNIKVDIKLTVSNR